MTEATIRFVGEVFQSVAWHDLMRELQLNVVGGYPETIHFTSSGNNIIGKERGFSRIADTQGFEWKFELKQCQNAEGLIKFYAILLAAFSIPQRVIVTIGDDHFGDRDTLEDFAESHVTNLFPVDDLIQSRLYREGEGISFL